MDKDSWSIWIPRIWFLGVLLLGIILILVGHNFLQDLGYEIVLGLGIALITAGIIGGIIEVSLFTKLVRNIFEIAFGYLLPKEISDEIRWIYGMTTLATNYHHDIVIEKCKDIPGKVFTYETISRTIKNIGNKDEEIKPSLGVQEWFHKEGYSEIISFKLTHNGKEYSLENGEAKVGRVSVGKQSNYILAIEENPLKAKLKPGKEPEETFTWVASIREIKHENEQSISFFGTASMNPYVTVKVPDGMDFDVTFANRKQGELEDLGSGHFRLNSLLLPGQAIRIRWWNINDSEKWKQEIDKIYQMPTMKQHVHTA